MDSSGTSLILTTYAMIAGEVGWLRTDPADEELLELVRRAAALAGE